MLRRTTLAAAIAALALLPYAHGLDNGFAFDDVTIVAENHRIRSVDGLRQLLTTDWWNGTTSGTTIVYRPLAMLTLVPDYALSRAGADGPAPSRLPESAARAFHAQNRLWHAAASVAFFLFVSEMFASPVLAFLAAALFAVHPVHTEAVYGIVGRAELISAFFVFLSLTTAWRCVQDDDAGVGRAALAGILLFLGGLSKEYAIVAPAVPVAWLASRSNAGRQAVSRRRSFWVLMGALIAGAVAIVALRAIVIGSVTGLSPRLPGLTDPNNPIATTTGAARWLTPVRVFGECVRLLVFPRTLSVDYSFAQILPVASPDAATMLCLLGLIALAGAAFALRKRFPAASFGIAFFFLMWLPTSNFVIPIGTILGERLLYLPSAGICLAAAAGICAIGRRWRRPAIAVACVLVLLGAARTWARAADWKDDLSLFTSAAAASPRSCKVRYNLAIDLRMANRPDDAIEQLTQALAIGCVDGKLHNNLAGLLAGQGRTDEAISNAETAVRLDATDPELAFNLAILLKQKGRIEEAIRQLNTSARLRPNDPAVNRALAEAHNDLGVALGRDNRISDAIAQFRAALTAQPDFDVARQNLARAEQLARPHP